MKRTFQQIGTHLGAVVTKKNAAYGSSFETSAEALKLLYPRGIAPKQMKDALLLVRIWDKMQRIATDKDAFGESPYGDITGYGILGVAMHQEKKDPCNTNARFPSATSSPAVATDSAAQRTAKRSISGSCKNSVTTSKRGANAARRAASSTPKRKR